MGQQHGRFADRTFEGTEVRFLEIRGSGTTGKWLFEIRALERTGAHTKRTRFVVEFLPKAYRLSRLGMVGQGSEIGMEEMTGLLEVPEEIKTAFEGHIRQECERRRITLRRTRQGPGYLLRQLATLLINAEIRPAAKAEREVLDIIRRHLENPVFIHRVKGATDQYHFGDEQVGRFFMKETPAYQE